jgi:hypothetical protein
LTYLAQDIRKDYEDGNYIVTSTNAVQCPTCFERGGRNCRELFTEEDMGNTVHASRFTVKTMMDDYVPEENVFRQVSNRMGLPA